MQVKIDDGGRAAAGFKGQASDCATRALAIAAEMPYREVYDLINQYGERERRSKKRRGKTNARTGVYKQTFRRIMEDLGWAWTPTMKIGQGCKVHLRAEELPSGRLIVAVSKHYVAVIDGVVHDTHDCTRNGTRCVYGYWQKKQTDSCPKKEEEKNGSEKEDSKKEERRSELPDLR